MQLVENKNAISVSSLDYLKPLLQFINVTFPTMIEQEENREKGTERNGRGEKRKKATD